MPMVITIMTPKGGSGKSTVVCNLAAVFASAGYKTAILDTDTASDQASAANWVLNRREAASAAQVSLVMVRLGEDVRQVIAKLRADRQIDVVLIDVSGRDSEVNRLAIESSDAWIVPVKPTQNDLGRMPYVQAMAEALLSEKPETLIHYVINEAPTTNRIETRAAQEFLSELGITPLETVIHCRKAYRDCIPQGLGVVEMPESSSSSARKAASEFTEFFAELMAAYQPILEYYLMESDYKAQTEVREAHGI